VNLRKDHNRKMVGSREFVRPEALKSRTGKRNDRTGWSSTRAMGDRETAVVRETSCRVPRVDRYPRAVETRSRPSGEGLRCLLGDGSIDSGCRAVERPPMPSHADGANLSASLRFRPRRMRRVGMESTRAMGDRETAVVRETSCRVPRVDRYPRAVETRSRPSV